MESLDPMDYPTDLYVLKNWLINRGLSVEMDEHKLYTDTVSEMPVISRIAGIDHIRVSSSKGKISIIRGMASFGDYEIYSLEGELFEDIERYPSVKSCGERVCELLE